LTASMYIEEESPGSGEQDVL